MDQGSMASSEGSGRYWRAVEPWRLLAPLALTGAAGGALSILLEGIGLPESGGSGGATHLLYAWWIPGLLFGLVHSATLRFEPHTALAFSTVTGVIFAGGVGLSLTLSRLSPSSLSIPFSWEGAVSGGLATWLFHRCSALFLGLRPGASGTAAPVVGALGVGTLTYLAADPGANGLGIVLISGLCAAGVGYTSFRLMGGFDRVPESSPSKNLRSLLQSGAVETVGLVATLASVISLFVALLSAARAD